METKSTVELEPVDIADEAATASELSLHRNGARQITIEKLPFIFVHDIQPERDQNGRIREFMPQARYKGAGISRLNPHGKGPF